MKLKLTAILIFLSLININGQTRKISVTSSCDGFSFKFNQPGNWVLDSENSAQFLAHSAIYKSKINYDNGGPLIQIFAFKKQDENTIEDLNFDINSYIEKYSNLKQKNLSINHHIYKVFSKEVYVEEEFHQYIVYLNPGKGFEYGVSVTLNINKTELLNEDLEIFKNLVRSIEILK